VLEELRLSPRVLSGRTRGPRPGVDAGADGGVDHPSLSTAFAEGGRKASTGAHSEFHRLAGTTKEEGVA